MTREEAIHFAECLKNNWTINLDDLEDFCNMAIEAIENNEKLAEDLQTCLDMYKKLLNKQFGYQREGVEK